VPVTVYDDNLQRILGGDGFVAVKTIPVPVRVPVTGQGILAQKASALLRDPAKGSGGPLLSALLKA
jgi:hypothetical protein